MEPAAIASRSSRWGEEDDFEPVVVEFLNHFPIAFLASGLDNVGVTPELVHVVDVQVTL